MLSFTLRPWRSLGLIAALLCSNAAVPAAEYGSSDHLRAVVDGVVGPLMAANRIPGMAVAVTVDGKAQVLNYGVASTESRRPVDDRTLFEIGSLSKTFTGTLGAWVEARGKLRFADPAAKHLPALAGSVFDRVSLLDLATYTAGGLPLQFPDAVRSGTQTVAFFKEWQPGFPPETRRLYSNASIGLFGDLAARAEGVPFERLMTRTLLPKLGLRNTYLAVPKREAAHYAFGTAKDDRPIRVAPGPFDAEAYGIKTTAGDLIRFVQLGIDPSPLEPPLREAIGATQTGYYRFGGTLQGLGWEIYDAPQSLDALLAGNSPAVTLEPQPVAKLDPPEQLRPDRFVNKTGSTNGFGAYAAFIPGKRLGIVLLANRAYPNLERVKAAWAILTALE